MEDQNSTNVKQDPISIREFVLHNFRKRAGTGEVEHSSPQRKMVHRVVEKILSDESEKDMIQYQCEEEKSSKVKESFRVKKDLLDKESRNYLSTVPNTSTPIRTTTTTDVDRHGGRDDDDNEDVDPLYGDQLSREAPQVYLDSELGKMNDTCNKRLTELADKLYKFRKEGRMFSQDEHDWSKEERIDKHECGPFECTQQQQQQDLCRESKVEETPQQVVCQVLTPVSDGISSAINELKPLKTKAAYNALIVLSFVNSLVLTAKATFCKPN